MHTSRPALSGNLASHGWYERAVWERGVLLVPGGLREELPALRAEEESSTILTGLVRLLSEAEPSELPEAAWLLGVSLTSPQPVRSGRYGRAWGEGVAGCCLRGFLQEGVHALEQCAAEGRDLDEQVERDAIAWVDAEAPKLALAGVDEGWISPGQVEAWTASMRLLARSWWPRLRELSEEREWGWLETSAYSLTGASGVSLRGAVAHSSWQRLSIVPEHVGRCVSMLAGGAQWEPAPELGGSSWEEARERSRAVGEIACALSGRGLRSALELAGHVLA